MLHALTAPRFGKRGTGLPTPEEHYRRLLGLPLGRRLFGPEINQAYKRAAETAHPDAGGAEREFLELSKARDRLMRRSRAGERVILVSGTFRLTSCIPAVRRHRARLP